MSQDSECARPPNLTFALHHQFDACTLTGGLAMASIIRPTVLRQSCLAAASKRAYTTKVSSSFPAVLSQPTRPAPARQAIKSAFAPGNVRVAAFHAGGRQQILPAGPQVIDGTANDAAVVPPTNASEGSYHWTFERLIAAGLVPLTIAPFVAGTFNPATDAIICGAVLLHSHIGFDAMITDYFPARRVPKTKKALGWVLKAATVAVGVGLYEFETNDVGVTEAIRRVWTA
ncbi:membrane anchor subunit of succinate dehydrogenase, Sdh4 [Pseudogymnoascus australis]